MANTIGPWKYRGDDGRDYVTGINTEVSAQMAGTDPDVPKIGGRAATSADAFPPLPSSVRPRRVFLKNPAGKGRYITMMDPDSWIGTVGRTLAIEDSDGASTTYTVRRLHGEKFGRSRV